MRLFSAHSFILLRSFWRAAHQFSVPVTPPYFIFCKFAQAALFPSSSLLMRMLKQCWPQYWPLVVICLHLHFVTMTTVLSACHFSQFSIHLRVTLSNTHFACDRVAVSYISTINPAWIWHMRTSSPSLTLLNAPLIMHCNKLNLYSFWILKWFTEPAGCLQIKLYKNVTVQSAKRVCKHWAGYFIVGNTKILERQ